MVVRFTPANKLTRGDRRFFGQTLKMACASQRRFVRLCDEDCVAFLSRDMRQALAVPKQVAAEAYRLIAVCPRVARAGNSALASDAAIAAALLEAGFAGACWNIGVNLKGKRNAQAILSRYASLRKRVQTCRARTEEEVGRITRR
jgi:formiminotetrahydrofolate cyclodeaminase